MSYKLISVRPPSEQDVLQWSIRSLEDELNVCDNRTLSDVFIEYLPKDGVCVEAGAGLGGWVRWLRDRGYTIVGIDCFPDVLEASKKADPTLDMRYGKVEQMPFEDGSIAAYISLGVIEHFEGGPLHVLREAYRILRPGGVAIITTPALNTVRRIFTHPLRTTAINLLRLTGKKVHFWEYRFTAEELSGFIAQAGFVIDGVREDDMVHAAAFNDPRHMGLHADFFFLRDHSGAWRLNRTGRFILNIVRRQMLEKYVVCGNAVIAHKPGQWPQHRTTL